jgi:hypothetical protein
MLLLLVIWGVEVNPGFKVEVVEIDQMVAYVMCQGAK